MGSKTAMTMGLGYKTEPWPVAMGSKTTMAVGPWIEMFSWHRVP